MHSYSQEAFSSQVRYVGDFLSRLERDHWQKRINQLKYEFANSSESPAFPFDSSGRGDDADFAAIRPALRQASLAQVSAQAQYWQPEGLVSRAPIARPIIRRDRQPSNPT